MKFNPRPGNLDHDQFRTVKHEVIQAAVEHECVFLASLILHRIAPSPDEAQTLRNQPRPVSLRSEAVDVLFVDEAGQMSLANVVAVARCAKSIVLLGDPQQWP